MKGTKQISAFTTKLSQQLGKFKDNSTIAIAHEQIKKLFAQYAFPEIINQFIGKMDNSDRLSDREKKEYAKIYISIIDTYGAEVLYQQYYQKLMDSLAKKTIGVGEVIGYLCKTLLSRIHPLQNTVDYINHILTVFRSHNDISKIIRNIVQSLDSTITTEFQGQMMSILTEKMNNKAKLEPIQAILSLVLTFEEEFEYETVVQNIVLKNYKNQDYNVRKVCVDICYALLVVKSQANGSLHRVIKQLKYDKIKHVREAVSNYNVLYKQLYGQQEQKKGDKRQAIGPRISAGQAQIQMNKSFKSNQRNQTFFKNAKNSNVIKVADQTKPTVSPIYQSQHGYQQYNANDDQQDMQYEQQQEYKQQVPVNPLRESLPKQFIQKLTEPQGNHNTIEQNRNFQKYLKKREKQYYEATHKIDSTSQNPQYNMGKQGNQRQIQKFNKMNSKQQLENKYVETPKNSDIRSSKSAQQKQRANDIMMEEIKSLKQVLTNMQKALMEKLIGVQMKTNENQQKMGILEKKIEQNSKLIKKGQNLSDFKETLKKKMNEIQDRQHQQIQNLQSMQNYLKMQFDSEKKHTNTKLNILTDQLIDQKMTFKRLLNELLENQRQYKTIQQHEVPISNPTKAQQAQQKKPYNNIIQIQQIPKHINVSSELHNQLEGRFQDVENLNTQNEVSNTIQKQSVQHKYQNIPHKLQNTPIQKLEQFMSIQPIVPHKEFIAIQQQHLTQKNESSITQIKQQSQVSNYNENKKELENSPNIYDKICDIKIENSKHEVNSSDQQVSEQSGQKNLDEKLKQSIEEQNWDEAYSIALGNSNQATLLKILEQQGIPQDKVVEECLLMALRKLLTKCQTLQWLNNYLRQRKMTKKHLKKFKTDLEKVQFEDNGSKQARNYIILRSMVSKQIQTQLNAK